MHQAGMISESKQTSRYRVYQLVKSPTMPCYCKTNQTRYRYGIGTCLIGNVQIQLADLWEHDVRVGCRPCRIMDEIKSLAPVSLQTLFLAPWHPVARLL